MKTRTFHRFTKEESDFIYNNYKELNARELTNKLNELYDSGLVIKQVQHFKRTRGLRSGKPHEVWKLPKTEKQRQNAIKQIVKYNQSKRKNIGHEYKFKDYNKVKVDEGKYIFKARYIYEKYNGKIPDDYVILHLDGNKSNDTIDNLIAIPKSYFNYLRVRGLIIKDKETNKTAIMSTDLLFKAIKKKKEVV